jgi:hypothetical protein
MSSKMRATHSMANPAAAGMVPVLLTPFSSVVYGIKPVADTAPKMHKNSPGHPQRTTAAMVAIRPPVRLFIASSSRNVLVG